MKGILTAVCLAVPVAFGAEKVPRAAPRLALEIEVASPGRRYRSEGFSGKYIWGAQHLDVAVRLINQGHARVTLCPPEEDWRASITLHMERVEHPALRPQPVKLEWEGHRIRKQRADHSVHEGTDYGLAPGERLLALASVLRPDGYIHPPALYILGARLDRLKTAGNDGFWRGTVNSPQIALLIRWKKTSEQRVEFCWLEAAYLRGRGRYDEAFRLLQEGLKTDPQGLCLSELGRTYHASGQLEKAIEVYERVLKIRPDARAIRAGLKRARRELAERSKLEGKREKSKLTPQPESERDEKEGQ